jgi:hypothetical protein
MEIEHQASATWGEDGSWFQPRLACFTTSAPARSSRHQRTKMTNTEAALESAVESRLGLVTDLLGNPTQWRVAISQLLRSHLNMPAPQRDFSGRSD